MGEAVLTAHDREAIAARGMAPEEVLRQLARLASPPAPLPLERPATVGDGILRLDEAEQARLLRLGEEARAAGRLSTFVPASGAASRMFQGPLALLAGWERERLTPEAIGRAARAGEADARETLALLENLRRFAFFEELEGCCARLGRSLAADLERGAWAPILEALLGEAGLGYGALPKGLIPFHRYPGGARTAFEEHLAAARRTVADAARRVRAHFTVGDAHRPRFERALEEARERLGREGHRFEVSFSAQAPATDTVALDEGGRPVRLADGSLLFRPGGHGSLLGNLQRQGGELVLLHNIDNVQPEGRTELVARWRQILAGLAAELQREAFDRPLRVCGMVAYRGEPGGGPFWVRSGAGEVTLQIVEASQVDRRAPDQEAVLRASTHFNPVDLLCALRDRRGRPFDLARFVDPDAAFVASKTHDGRPIRALEHPGLWNGGMAGWLTVFVEIPAETFAPVKTVLDLLRPEHQPAPQCG